ncbi:hypothetical protein OF83DRAFT_1085678 [Amylostereum chailletii]|nr:hypothetical protein OF83DRAFT_1085678 [Amylostereum chailletii]
MLNGVRTTLWSSVCLDVLSMFCNSKPHSKLVIPKDYILQSNPYLHDGVDINTNVATYSNEVMRLERILYKVVCELHRRKVVPGVSGRAEVLLVTCERTSADGVPLGQGPMAPHGLICNQHRGISGQCGLSSAGSQLLGDHILAVGSPGPGSGWAVHKNYDFDPPATLDRRNRVVRICPVVTQGLTEVSWAMSRWCLRHRDLSENMQNLVRSGGDVGVCRGVPDTAKIYPRTQGLLGKYVEPVPARHLVGSGGDVGARRGVLDIAKMYPRTQGPLSEYVEPFLAKHLGDLNAKTGPAVTQGHYKDP